MLLGAAIVVFAIVMIAVPPIAQPASYHDFADQRVLVAGIPNTFDVLSNIAFVIAGVFGLIVVRRAGAPAATQVFIAGTFATAIGSTYYHLRPDDNRLVFDRLGMVICFAALVAVLVSSRAQRGIPSGSAPEIPRSARNDTWLIAALIAFGTATILWWRYTNDLRAWGFVQFFPMLLLFVKRDKTLIGAALLYALAKACEIFDKPIFAATHAVSGHTLKHLVAGAATMVIVSWIARASYTQHE